MSFSPGEISRFYKKMIELSMKNKKEEGKIEGIKRDFGKINV